LREKFCRFARIKKKKMSLKKEDDGGEEGAFTSSLVTYQWGNNHKSGRA